MLVLRGKLSAGVSRGLQGGKVWVLEGKLSAGVSRGLQGRKVLVLRGKTVSRCE